VEIKSLFGLPAHVFLVHIPVILVPLVSAGAVLILWPSMRRRFGWALVVLAGVAFVATILAEKSGKALRPYVIRTSLVRQHTRIGENLNVWSLLLFGFIAVVVVWDQYNRWRDDDVSSGLGGAATKALRGYAPSAKVVRGVALTLGALSVIVAGMSTYWVYRIGHTGAKASWSTVQHRIDTGKRVGDEGNR
jgi:hypothetical protein